MKLGAGKLGMIMEATSAIFSRWTPSWYTLGAVILGGLLAKWTWILFSPHALSVFPAKQEVAATASDTLFGVAVLPEAITSNAAPALPNVSLVGVFSGKQGFAVLKLDDKKQQGVALGEEVSAGTKLVEVAADHVLLERNGVRHRVNLENKFADSKGLTVRPSSSVSPAAEMAMANWNKARQEMQKGQGEASAHH